jgi:tRNA dimethylallyltransferase
LSADEQRLLCVVGPTASGKSALALRLAEALGGEIVSADSMQIYRGFDIGTGKPSAAERAQVPHHLVDVAEPLEVWDAARWRERSKRSGRAAACRSCAVARSCGCAP